MNKYRHKIIRIERKSSTKEKLIDYRGKDRLRKLFQKYKTEDGQIIFWKLHILKKTVTSVKIMILSFRQLTLLHWKIMKPTKMMLSLTNADLIQ